MVEINNWKMSFKASVAVECDKCFPDEMFSDEMITHFNKGTLYTSNYFLHKKQSQCKTCYHNNRLPIPLSEVL